MLPSPERVADQERADPFTPVRVHFPVNAPEFRPPIMPPVVNYDNQTGEDSSENALEKACNFLKGYEFEEHDLDYYFNQIELKMKSSGVKKSYTKFQILTTILPVRVRDQVKPLLRKQETDFGNEKPYKLLKDQIIKIFKPPEESDYERAKNRVLSGKPSELARTLVNDLCEHELSGCCCRKYIVGMWKEKLPVSVRQGIAGQTFDSQNFENIITLADKIFAERTLGQSVASLQQQGAVSLPGPPVLDQGFHQDFPQEVSAVSYRGGRGRGGRGRGRGNRGQNQRPGQNRNGGQGQNSQGQSHQRHKTPRHPDLPPIQSCFRHWTFGKSAHFCMEPASCPWKDFYVPKPNQ